MLPIPEYRAAAAGYARRARWVYPATLLNLLVVFSPLVYLSSQRDALVTRARTHIHPEFLPWHFVLGWFVCCLVETFLYHRLVNRSLARSARRDPRLVCPRCGWCPGRGEAWCEAVATRRCRRCGQEFLADVAQPPPGPPPLARAEVEEAMIARLRVWRRTRWRLRGLLLVTLGVVAGFAFLVDSGRTNEDLTLGGIVSASVACMLAAVWLKRPLRELARVGVTCPRCGGRWAPEWVQKFGGCGFCGQPLVADPEPDGVAAGAAAG